ncbi:hypothetical protein HGRIS_002590 [Hohenbuehelia grisea]|uniref:Cytochrome P450 n=1 Tax=Hohenbuehelia grisea TaxID=104357 RepID=A0ABR3JL44_9AGAR
MAMALHPHVVLRAQKELDEVLHGDRLPTFDDRPSLPYIDAIFREVLRWRPVTPLGFPHVASEDDIYEGYFIHKNSIVIPNIWAMTRDPSKHEDPESFRPERFLDANGQLTNEVEILTFGFGRRICPGRHVASDTLWLLVASVLTVFSITKAKDESGNEVDIDANDFTDEIVSRPSPFRCSIQPRSPAFLHLIPA